MSSTSHPSKKDEWVINYERMSRHLYDLERLMETEHAEAALADTDYFFSIIEHRRNFIFKTGVDYDSHHPMTLNFIPPKEVAAAFEEDYALMREQMIYDVNSLDLKTILERLGSLLKGIRERHGIQG